MLRAHTHRTRCTVQHGGRNFEIELDPGAWRDQGKFGGRFDMIAR